MSDWKGAALELNMKRRMGETVKRRPLKTRRLGDKETWRHALACKAEDMSVRDGLKTRFAEDR
jgi:hypothetical protein